ncbi:MAG: peptidyl-prolyl cis-trans isomerase [Patulibacter sp.]
MTCAVAIPLTLGLAACGGDDDKISSDSVANVDGTQISKAEYDQNLKFQTVLASQQFTNGELFKSKDPKLVSFAAPYTECIKLVKKQVPKGQKVTDTQLKEYCESIEKQLKDGAIGQLLTSKFLSGEAKDDKIEISDAEITKALPAKYTQTIGGKENLPKFTKLTGLDEAAFRDQVKTELIGQKIQEKITKSAGKVTDAEVQEYYNKNKAQYTQPEMRDLRVVLTKTKAQADEAKKELDGGKDFAAVVKEFSIDTITKKDGGKLANVAKGQQEKALADASFSAKKGEIVGPIKTETGFYVVRVDKVTASKLVPFKDVKEQIKQQLTQTKPQEALTKWQTDTLDTWKDKTNCREGYIVDFCKNAPKPKTNTATTAAPAQ